MKMAIANAIIPRRFNVPPKDSQFQGGRDSNCGRMTTLDANPVYQYYCLELLDIIAAAPLGIRPE
jgi:hypothetical protein